MNCWKSKSSDTFESSSIDYQSNRTVTGSEALSPTDTTLNVTSEVESELRTPSPAKSRPVNSVSHYITYCFEISISVNFHAHLKAHEALEVEEQKFQGN